MKKTLLVLAVLAASGAAFAQSSVTLYGKTSIGLVSETGKGGLKLQDGPDGNNSRWGLRGVEDLGGGLYANFVLEAGFNLDDGTPANALAFQRAANMSLRGGFGKVTLGRDTTISGQGAFGNMIDYSVNPQMRTGLAFNGVGSRNDNQIVYQTPNFSGFSVKVGTQLKNDTANPLTEIGLVYGAGPVTANFTYAKAKTGTDKTAMGINASYDFGVAKVSGGYTDVLGNSQKGFHAEVSAPVGAATVYAQIARNTTTKTTAYSVGTQYNLSKRTQLYAMYGAGNQKVTNYIGTGIAHNF